MITLCDAADRAISNLRVIVSLNDDWVIDEIVRETADLLGDALMPEYTTTQAAEILQTNRRNVQNYAKRHGLSKFGREYIITESDIEEMRNELGKPGPKKKNQAL